MALRLTVVTSSSCDMTKTFARDEHGVITSSAIAHMASGHARIVELTDVFDLADLLSALTPNQALTLGVPIAGDSALTTRAGAAFKPDAVARTNETFRYLDAPALLPIDVDIDANSGAYQSVEDVLDALEACSPWLRAVSRVARPSSSSFVAGRGLRGVHVYVPVTRGTDIPELGKRLQIEQWSAGRGKVVISRSGALLVRQLSDALVYQPSRLMFEALPVLQGGVTRDVPPDQAFIARVPERSPHRAPKYKTELGWLDAQELPAIKDIDRRRFDVAVRTAKDRQRAEAKRVAMDYHRANAIAAGLPEEGEYFGVLAIRALGDRRLPLEWSLRFDGIPEPITVKSIRDNLPMALGRFCADPFDTHRTDLTPAHLCKAEVVMMRGKPGVWSHKLQEFFEFADAPTKVMHSPLDLAAERLCGTIDDWPDARDKKRSSLRNLKHAIERLTAEADYDLQYDVCTDAVRDIEEVPLGRWLDLVSHLGCTSVTAGVLENAVEDVARAHPVDPWKDVILSLPIWDKVPRLDQFFSEVFGTIPTPALAAVTQCFFAGIAARQLMPGAPVAVVPVLISDKQGSGKSLFVHRLARVLGFPKPTDLAFGEVRRMSMAAARAPIAELGEMTGLSKRDAEEIKQWLTETCDVYRAPYGRKEESHPRRFVTCGTANVWELNRDPTGNRRMFPVLLEHDLTPGWETEVKQVLAEARARFDVHTAAYEELQVRAADLTRDYNQEAMRRGLGTPVSDLDDLLPAILARLASAAGAPAYRVASAAIRQALEASSAGKRCSAQAVSKWMTARGWRAVTDAQGHRSYQPPATYVDILINSDILPANNPFTRTA